MRRIVLDTNCLIPTEAAPWQPRFVYTPNDLILTYRDNLRSALSMLLL